MLFCTNNTRPSTLRARALDHHIERPIFIQVDEHGNPGIRNARERVYTFAHLSPSAPGT
jgi:hypothetical protein